jgi:hypothetical protein
VAAHCDECDGHVMRYRTYAFWLKPTARCEECGAHVRLRGFWTMAGIGGVIAAGLLAALAVIPSAARWVAVLGLAALLSAIDYASYHFLSWEGEGAIGPGDDGLPGLAGRAEGRLVAEVDADRGA